MAKEPLGVHGGGRGVAEGEPAGRLLSLRHLLVAAFAVFLLFSATSSGTASAGAGDAPAWRLGERWGYAGTVFGPGPREDFTANVTVVALAHEIARVRAEIRYGFGTVVQDTLVALPSFRITAFNASFPNGIRHRFAYAPSLELLSFPLAEGKAWSAASNFTYSYRTLPLATVSTPAGTFDAFPVEQNAMGIPFITLELILPDLGHAVMYYASSVGQLVRYEAFDLRETLVAQFALTTYSIPSGTTASAVPPGPGTALGVAVILLVGSVGVASLNVLRTVRSARA